MAFGRKIQGYRGAYRRPFVSGTTAIEPPSTYQSTPSVQESDVLYRFNETDASQVSATIWAARCPDQELPPPDPVYYALNGTATFKAAGADGGVGPRILFDCDNNSPTIKPCLFQLIDPDTNDSWQVPDRFEIRFRIAHLNSLSIGFFLHNNQAVSGPFWGYGFANLHNAASTELILCEGGGGLCTGNEGAGFYGVSLTAVGTTKSGIAVSNTGTNPSVGGYLSYLFDTVPATASTHPYPMFTAIGLGSSGSSSFGGNTWPPHGSNSILGSSPAAGWTNRTGLNYLSIVCSPPSGPNSGTAELAEFMVIKHPHDRF